MRVDQCPVTTPMGEVRMNRPHFRLKVDLSKFFHDVRRFCWIFVDGTKIKQVIHMKQHISKLFNIEEPFHLLLNDSEYLPPIEDARILKENETILVVPGSGIYNEVSGEMSSETVNDTSDNVIQPTPITNTTRDMTFYSVISDTMVDHNGRDTDSKTTDNNGEDTDSKTTDNNVTEDCNMMDSIISVAKRKRVRKRRPKNPFPFAVSPLNITEDKVSKESKSKKPKIIDSYVIPSGKHIRFDNMESDENNIAKQIVQEISKNESKNESCSSKAPSSKDLSTLLALGQSSMPITFTNENKKLKNGIKTESVNDEINKNFNKIMEDSTEKNSCNRESKKETQSYKSLHAELEKVPIMTRKPQYNDIIAFKTLKIGADYTPQMSNFIFSKVVGASAQNYTLQILCGREEIQVPFGKFSVSEDESESHCDEDTFVINYSQMIDVRLIS